MMSSNFLQSSNAAGGLEDIVKLADLMSNKKDVAKFLDSLKEAEKSAKEQTVELNKAREKFEMTRGIKAAMDDLDAYKKDCKTKADKIILKAKDDAALIMIDATEEQSQAQAILLSVNKQEISLNSLETKMADALASAFKKEDAASKLETKMKKLVDQANIRIKKVTSLVEALKNV